MEYLLEIRDGSLCITADGEVFVSDITGYLKHPGELYNVITVAREGEWELDGGSAHCDNFTFEMTPCREGILVRGTYTNTTGKAFRQSLDFTPFAGVLHRTVDRAFLNEYFPQNGNKVCEMQSKIDKVRTVYGTVYESAENSAFDTLEGESFAFGAATYEKYFSGVTLTREGFITARCDTELHVLDVGGSVTSEWFYLAPYKDAESALVGFAKTVAEIAGAPYIERENPVGFCTWYYYFTGVTPEAIRANMAVLDEHKEDLPVKYIQIDDGWFDRNGSWKPNEKFGDMKKMADEIKAHGYIPGIWLAPFWCSKKFPELTEEHPDWFVHDLDGNLMPGSFAIDYTHPEAREYMANILHTMAYDWGFRYFKLDVISLSLSPGVHHDPEATALSNYRLGLRTIRENITPDSFILDCTAPLGGACGLVDGMRVSCDVFERWESLIDVFNATLNRFYLHRNYYLIDSDCLIVRKKENEDGECGRYCTRTDTEIRTYVTAMAASGGILMLSDKLPLLSDDQLRLISKLFPVNQDVARPLDLMESNVPGILDFGKCGKTRTVALINWGDAPREMSVDSDEALVFEFWSEKAAYHKGGSFKAKIAPRSAMVYFFTEPSSLAVIGSDSAVKMQNEWKLEGEKIIGKRLKKNERVFAASKKDISETVGCTSRKIAEADGYGIYEITPHAEEYVIG